MACYTDRMTSVDEESDLSNATDTVSLTVELPRALVERLNFLAARGEWSAAMFMEEALADYLPAQERLFTEIEGAIAEADSDGKITLKAEEKAVPGEMEIVVAGKTVIDDQHQILHVTPPLVLTVAATEKKG